MSKKKQFTYDKSSATPIVVRWLAAYHGQQNKFSVQEMAQFESNPSREVAAELFSSKISAKVPYRTNAKIGLMANLQETERFIAFSGDAHTAESAVAKTKTLINRNRGHKILVCSNRLESLSAVAEIADKYQEYSEILLINPVYSAVVIDDLDYLSLKCCPVCKRASKVKTRAGKISKHIWKLAKEYSDALNLPIVKLSEIGNWVLEQDSCYYCPDLFYRLDLLQESTIKVRRGRRNLSD